MSFLMTSFAFAQEDTTTSIQSFLSGNKGESVTYSFEIINNDSLEHSYIVEKSEQSNLYQVQLVTTGNENNPIVLGSNDKKVAKLNLIIPKDSTLNSDEIKLNLIRDDSMKIGLSLSLEIKNDYGLVVVNQMKNLSGISGKSMTVDVVVQNSGHLDLNHIALEYNLPSKWVIESVSPADINLKSGEMGSFSIKLLIPSSQSPGNSNLEIKGISDQISSDSIVMPIKVSKNVTYGFFALGLLIIAVMITLLAFKKHGRR
jgi:uncharacterized membrane protein